MGLKTKFASIASAAVLGLGISAATFAQTGGPTDVPVDVSVVDRVDKGFSWTIAESVPFPDVPYSFTNQTVTGAMSVTVSDTRGTNAGWTLYISGTDFVGQTTGDTIPIGNLALTPGTIEVLEGQNTPLPAGSPVSAVSGTPQLIFSAASGAGAGRYATHVSASFVIPGNTRVDTYATTLKVGLTAAP